MSATKLPITWNDVRHGRKARVVLVALCVMLIVQVAAAQSVPDCSAVAFVAPSAARETLVVDALEGQAVFAEVGAARDLGSATGVCLALFRPNGERLAIGSTERSGDFVIRDVGAGAYVLIGSIGYAHTLAVPVKIAANEARVAATRGLQLHMRSKEDERTSFATVIGNLELRTELLDMLRVDQEIRFEMIARGLESIAPEIQTRMATIDAKNTERLLEIVEQHGWPRPELVSFDGAEAAFTIVQHSTLDVQKAMFPHIEAAYRDGAASGQSYALLLDRILTREGKPQIYGSQARPSAEWVNGEPTFFPIEDEANLDARRAEVGLPPHGEYREMLKQLYLPQPDPPPR